MDGSSLTRQLLQWAIGVLAALFVGVAVAAALVDANYFRAPLVRLIAAHTGRQILIAGTLETHLLSFTPRVTAQSVTIGNPQWMPQGSTAEIGRLEVAFEFLPLFTWSVVIHSLQMERVKLHLARDSKGKANWQWTEPGEAGGKGSPLIHSLSMPDAQVELDDARRHLRFEGVVSARDVPGEGARPLRIDGAGQLNGRAAAFVIDGEPLAAVSADRAYRFVFLERSSGSRLNGHGFLSHPFDFRALDIAFDAVGADLKDLYFLIGVTLPNTGSYHLSGNLTRQGPYFRYSNLTVTSGQSDMHGTLSIDTSSPRSKLAADLYSQTLRSTDLGARAAGREMEPQGATRLLLPDTTLRLSGLQRSDAVVDFHAHNFAVGRVLLHAVAVHTNIEQGTLTAVPLSAAFSAGQLYGRIRIDATGTVPRTDLDIRIVDLGLSQFDPLTNPPLFDGQLQVRLVLSGEGNSIHQVAATADGTVTAVLPHGTIRTSLAEFTALDFMRGLGLLLGKGRQDTPIRCGVASFRAHAGTLTAQSVVLDTVPVLITGTGTVHLDSENLDLAFRGAPKRWRMRLRSPVALRGTLTDPSFGIETRDSLMQTGEAVALGVVLTPLAALLAFVDPGLAKDADCAALLSGSG